MWNWTTKVVSFDTTANESDAKKPKPGLSRTGTTSWMYNWARGREEPVEAEEAPAPPAETPSMLSRAGTTSWMYDWSAKTADDGSNK